MFKEFDIEVYDSPEFHDRIDRFTVPYAGNPDVIRFALEGLRHKLHAQTAVFEYQYVDKDYQDEFSTYYSKAFKSYSNRCIRVHFFNRVVPKRTVLLQRYQDAYLGCIVLRPTDLQRMGRTLIRPWFTDSDSEFITCTAPFEANLLGSRFQVLAMPFVQQDTQVGACAQASLWMLARYMSRRFGHREFLPSEINQYAKSHTPLGRHYPAETGLTIDQMLDALQGMGFSALSYAKSELDDYGKHIESIFPISTAAPEEEQETQRVVKLADIAYRYIESSLPVIFTTHNHALVGIGHSYDHTKVAKLAIQRIPGFFVNNDDVGPYAEMPILKPASSPSMVPFRDIEHIIIVTPQEATLCGDDAESMARNTLMDILDYSIQGKQFKEFIADARPDFARHYQNLEYRTYLVPSVELQRGLLIEMGSKALSSRVARKLVRLNFPKYVWVTEVSSSELLNHPKKTDRKCFGRIITDSTAPKATKGVMAFHCFDLLCVIDRQGLDAELIYVPGSTPFAHRFTPHH